MTTKTSTWTEVSYERESVVCTCDEQNEGVIYTMRRLGPLSANSRRSTPPPPSPSHPQCAPAHWLSSTDWIMSARWKSSSFAELPLLFDVLRTLPEPNWSTIFGTMFSAHTDTRVTFKLYLLSFEHACKNNFWSYKVEGTTGNFLKSSKLTIGFKTKWNKYVGFSYTGIPF